MTILALGCLVYAAGMLFGAAFDIATNPQGDLRSVAWTALVWPAVVWEIVRR